MKFPVLISLSSVIQGVKYQYRIQVETGHLLSFPSPPLVYTHGQTYCGDGVIQGSVHLSELWLLVEYFQEKWSWK